MSRRMLKKAVSKAAASEGPEAWHSSPALPSCQDSSFPKWGTLRI